MDVGLLGHSQVIQKFKRTPNSIFLAVKAPVGRPKKGED